jgi:putative membrane protein
MLPWLSRHLDHAGRERIEAALRTADQATCGEIVPVVARRSARYGHAPWLAAALCLAAAESADWTGFLVPAWGHRAVAAAALALLCAACGWLLARFPGVRRALTPRADRIQSVHRAAEAAFHHLALHRARGDAGVLLYVSLEERWAVVLAGAGIADLAGPAHWEETCRLLTSSAAKRDLAGGFEQAIAHTARVMALHHPAVAGGPPVVLNQRLRILHDTF